MNERLEPKDCPTCGTPKALQSKESGAWPAFYESSESSTHILWISPGGQVVNGGGRPTFSVDRLTCWFTPDHIHRWVAPAPVPVHSADGNVDYNTVILDFQRSRATA